MTNATIVFLESIKLMEAGIIGTTGKMITVEMPDGEKKDMLEPEQIHTYNGWKELGYQVKRGSKAVAQFNIWKYRYNVKEMEMTNVQTGNKEMVEVDLSKMFMKRASWFTKSQVEEIKED